MKRTKLNINQWQNNLDLLEMTNRNFVAAVYQWSGNISRVVLMVHKIASAIDITVWARNIDPV